MPTDYTDAAERHFQDAQLLDHERRLPNADQLYGLSAECALKALVVGLGVPTDTSGRLAKPWGSIHVDEVWSEFQTFVNGRQAGRCLAPLRGFDGNPFDDWKIDQRYAPASEVASSSILLRHARAARACQTALERWRTDGGRP